MTQMFGQMMTMPISMFACWMDMFAMAIRCMQPSGRQGFDASNQCGSNQYGRYMDNQPAQGDGATEAKEEKDMSDCCCCDNDNNDTVRLVEYSIVSIKRCDERILKKGEIIDAENMGDEAFATWVVALYLQEPGVHVPHDDKKYLRVYHRVLESWPRQSRDCCGDSREVNVLRGIEEAIRNLGGGGWRRDEGTTSGGPTPAPATS